MTLTYLDLLVQKDNLQKSQFFKGLPKVVAKLPKVKLLCLVFFSFTWSLVMFCFGKGLSRSNGDTLSGCNQMLRMVLCIIFMEEQSVLCVFMSFQLRDNDWIEGLIVLIVLYLTSYLISKYLYWKCCEAGESPASSSESGEGMLECQHGSFHSAKHDWSCRAGNERRVLSENLPRIHSSLQNNGTDSGAGIALSRVAKKKNRNSPFSSEMISLLE